MCVTFRNPPPQSVGVHWGTFRLTGEPLLEPPRKLEAAAELRVLYDSDVGRRLTDQSHLSDVVPDADGDWAHQSARQARRRNGRR